LREEEQLTLLGEFRTLYDECDLPERPSSAYRFYYFSGFFPAGDSVILYSFMRTFNCRRITEIGGGFSSAAMLDVNDNHISEGVHLRFLARIAHRPGQALAEVV
jgi:hypothetical protein